MSYSQRSNPDFEAIMALRTAAKEGAFFLPHLRQGMRVLDVGCGPGSITLGLAEAVGAGEAVGIDIQPSQVAQAQALSSSRGVLNTRFEVGDANQLPFSDASFDAVFANSVLGHLHRPDQALAEMRRVLRPGGFVGIRDLDWGGRIYTPATPLLEEWYELTIRIRQRNGGNPFLGRHLRKLLLEAGFKRPEASVSGWSCGSQEEIRLCAIFLKAQLQGFASVALSEGWVDQGKIEAVAADIEVWAGCQDAFYMDSYCEAVATVEG
jgi:SAM-dependent methyltransferase